MTISRQFTIWIAGIVLITAIGSGIVYYRSAMQEELSSSESYGHTIGQILEQSIAASMMQRQQGEVQRVFQEFSSSEAIRDIYLLNRDRVVRASTAPSLVGSDFTASLKRCHGCHEGETVSRFYRFEDTFRYVHHVANAKACRTCHQDSLKYNGVIVIDFAAPVIQRNVQRQMLIAFLIFLPSILLLGLGTIILSRQLIHKRVLRLIRGVQDMATGRYDTRLPVEKSDEITHLAVAFNEMSHAVEERDRDRDLLYRQVSRSFEMWQSTFDAISDLIAIIDSEGRLFKANNAFLSYFGMTASQANGKDCVTIITGSGSSADSPCATALKDRCAASGEVFNERLNRTFHVAVYPYSYHEAQFDGFVLVARDITERKLSEEARAQALELARAEKEKTDAIIAAIGDGIVIMDRERRVLYQNDVVRRMAGDHIGEYCHMAFEQNGSVCEGCPVSKTFADGKIHTSERVGKGENGPMYVEITSSPLKDADGTIIAGIEVVRDISRRKKQETTIRRNYAMQEVITRILQIGLEPIELNDVLARVLDLILSVPWLSIESQGSIFVAEPGSDRLTMMASKGLSSCVQEECSSLRVGTCLCGIAAARREVQYADRVDERHELCGHGIDPHGHYCMPIIYSGAAIGVLNLYLKEGHVRDEDEIAFLEAAANALAGIIRRRLVEQERERLMQDLDEALYKVIKAQKEWVATFDSIMDMIAIIDEEYTITRVNKAFAAYFGLIPQEVLGKKCHELMHGNDTPLGTCPHRKTLLSHLTSTAEIVDQRTRKVFKVTTFPFYSPLGEITGTIHISRDITEERDRELRLIMSERLASLGQMASGIAHEINNPLAAIGGCAEGLMNRVRQDRIDKALFENYLEIIQEEVLRCKNITGGMLSIVRKSSYERKEIHLSALLRKTIELVNFQGRLKNVEVVERYDEALPAFPGNEGELKQAFLSIITNGLDAMGDHGTLTVSTSAEDGRQSVSIGDTGCGIPEEHVVRIFDPFFTLKSDRGGTGLGLSIANRIIANHHGVISVSSEEGKGTTFTITFSPEES